MEDTDMQISEESDKGVGTHRLRLAEINIPFNQLSLLPGSLQLGE